VPVYGLGTYDDGRPFYAMRLIRGDSLQDAINCFHRADGPGRDPGEGTLSHRQLLRRFIDVCNAIAYAHSRGVLHRDLKPGNVMLGKYGETVVVAWGLAKPLSQPEQFMDSGEPTLLSQARSGLAMTQVGQVLGTPAYMSPEQAAGRLEELGPSSDVYSLVAILYCLLTGKPPLEEPNGQRLLRRVQTGEFAPPRQVKPAVSEALEAICQKAMALRPGDRYPSPRELTEDLEHWLADEPVRQAVQTDLDEVAHLQGQARWAEARAALGRAEGRLGLGGPSDLRLQLVQVSRDFNLVVRLDAIRLEQLTFAEENRPLAEADRAYAAAFADAGLGTVGDDPQKVAHQVKKSRARNLVVGTLGDWASCTSDHYRLDWLLQVARRADPDPWRDRARDLATYSDRAALERLACEEAATVQSPWLIAALGYRLVRAGGEATDLLPRVQARNPDDVWLNHHLGEALMKSDPKEAAGYYRAALAIRPDTPVVLYSLGNALRAQGRWEEAKAELEKALGLNPKFALPHNVLGIILKAQGQLAGAKAEFEMAATLDPKYGIPYLGLSIVLHELGRLEEAKAEFENAIALDPRLAHANGNLEMVLQAEGRLDVMVENRHALA
jgi:tetratricopeptide (TPR) repeat protein